MKTIPQLLNKTAEQYEFLVMETFIRWCMDFCTNNYESELQSLIANSKMNKYFLFELAKGETEFLKLISRYKDSPTVTTQDAERLYSDCTFQIFNRSPKPLIEEAKKLKVYEPTAN